MRNKRGGASFDCAATHPIKIRCTYSTLLVSTLLNQLYYWQTRAYSLLIDRD